MLRRSRGGGYRFIAPVEKLGESAPGQTGESESGSRQTQAASEPETSELETDEPEHSGADPTSEQTPPDEPKRHVQPVYVGLAVAVLALIVVAAYLGTIIGYDPATTPKESGISTERPSIAVLPLENVGGGEENEYFSDGVTDDIIAQLSKMSAVKVISRISSMQYKNTDKGLRQIGEELSVRTVLQGSVRRSDDRIRIVAQLMEVESDETLWAQT